VIAGSRLRLAWYRSPSVQQGERWNVNVRVKPPWGYQNPGGFDFERWLLSERLQGTGYVVAGSLLEPAGTSAVGRFRDGLDAALSSSHLAVGGALYVLVSGDGSRLSSVQWELFRTTGTIYLMVVSGLHVGLVTMLGYFLVGWLVRALPPLLLWIPARRAGAVGGIAMTGCFVVFTGSGVPGVRALCMSSMAFLALMSGRRIRVFDSLLLALSVVLVLDPLVVHQKGFWLSFCAVAALAAFFTGRYQRHSGWRSVWSPQLALFVGLTPMLAVLHGQIPVVGVIANMLAVPVMSVAITPLVLISAALFTPAPELAGFGFYLVDRAMVLLLQFLEALAGFGTLQVVAPPLLAAVAMCAATLLLRGTSTRNQILLWLLWLCWWLPRDAGVLEGEFRVIALDVGQGSSILVDTSKHRLLFDAGPSYPSGFDLGMAVVVPSVAATGARRLDVMVLSHADLDHRGGAQSVLGAVPVERVFESVPGPGSDRCRAGVSWIWDRVTFSFLSPLDGPQVGSDNDGSCVLEINNGRERVILPGDISAVVERRLLRDANVVRLLFAPHHGSNTSTSRARSTQRKF
jgi:competence protein ComEC